MNIEPMKSKKVENEFKFLGVEWNLDKEEVRYKESVMS